MTAGSFPSRIAWQNVVSCFWVTPSLNRNGTDDSTTSRCWVVPSSRDRNATERFRLLFAVRSSSATCCSASERCLPMPRCLDRSRRQLHRRRRSGRARSRSVPCGRLRRCLAFRSTPTSGPGTAPAGTSWWRSRWAAPLGSLGRWALGELLVGAGPFPWATFVENVTGCLRPRGAGRARLRPVAAVPLPAAVPRRRRARRLHHVLDVRAGHPDPGRRRPAGPRRGLPAGHPGRRAARRVAGDGRGPPDGDVDDRPARAAGRCGRRARPATWWTGGCSPGTRA